MLLMAVGTLLLRGEGKYVDTYCNCSTVFVYFSYPSPRCLTASCWRGTLRKTFCWRRSAVLESTSPPLRTTFLKKMRGGEVETEISHPKNTSKKSAPAAGFIKLKRSLHFLNKLMAHNFLNDIYWSLSYHVPYFSSVVHIPSIIIDSMSTKQWYYALIVT